MKMLRDLLFLMLMGIAITSQAMDQDVQVDLLMAKITNALKQNRVADALPAFAQLESMEPTLQNPLSEGFHFLYIDTLDKSGNHAKALSRANIYMDKFGKQGKYYDKVIEIMSRLQDQVEEEKKVEAKRTEAERLRIKDIQEGRSPYCYELSSKLIKLSREEEQYKNKFQYPCDDAPQWIKDRMGWYFQEGAFSRSCRTGRGSLQNDRDKLNKEYDNNQCSTPES